jgi:hypothetical protein
MRIVMLSLAIAGALTIGGGTASGQTRFEVGLLLGGTMATDEATVLQFDTGTTYQATFAWRVWESRLVRISGEVPFLASPAFTVTTPGGSLPKEYATAFLTPGVRVTVRPRGALSFFGTLGGGYARYSESKLRADESPNPQQRDTNTGALQFGGGVDVRGFRWLGFRGEVRDVVTGARKFSIPTPGPSVHNVAVSGGLVVHF